MKGEFSGDSRESGGGDGLMGLLRTLNREEILEVLSEGFCEHCEASLANRAHCLINKKRGGMSRSNGSFDSSMHSLDNNSELSNKKPHQYDSNFGQTPEFARKRGFMANSSSDTLSSDRFDIDFSEEQKEHSKFAQVGRKKDFNFIERINGKSTNVLQGLELHTGVFNAEEQKKIVDFVYKVQRLGQKRQLRERTYSEPRKWMRGKGRVTIQFGCCYNYATDNSGNPPGIIRDEEVDPLPPLFKQMIKRMVRWHVLPPLCIPDSCIVNIYDEGDCIPPHIDHHDFLRPFCTVSFLTECNILFGSNLKILSPGEFAGPVSIPLPVGSVLVLNGNGADVAKHCVPAVPSKRISITFRKMDDSKMPYKFVPDTDLQGLKPLVLSRNRQDNHHQPPFTQSTSTKSSLQVQERRRNGSESRNGLTNRDYMLVEQDFPPLGSRR